MIHRLLLGLALIFTIGLLPSFDASALGLKVAPLSYKATLKEGERKQGVVDVSNPSSHVIDVRASVQAFRQIDDDGGLQFYDDEQVKTAIKPDLTEFTLGPREALRLAFTIDSNGLPEGDVFAAIFLTTEPSKPQNGVGQSVRVGTLLSLINKSPGSRVAELTGLDVPFIQLDDTVTGTYRIKNTGPKDTGFYPTVTVSSWPSGSSRQLESSLLFGGRERSNEFRYRTGYGIHRLELRYGDSTRSQWVVVIQPWVVIVALLAIGLLGIEYYLYRRRKQRAKP